MKTNRDHKNNLNIRLIMPDARIHKLKLGPLDLSFREAPLTLTTLAALVPESIKAKIRIVDMSVGQAVPYDRRYDLVGISLLTGTAPQGYAIADQFLKTGTTVVLGGVHVTLMPEEASRHSSAIVVGFAEQTWPLLLQDFAHNRLKKIYSAKQPELSGLPAARRDLQKNFGYMVPNTVFATRGCRGGCEFCSVPAAKFGWHKRPVGEVIDEIRQIRSRRIAFNDVHLTEDTDYAKELFSAMIPLRKKWGGLASTRVADDLELLMLMRKSGCRFLLIGFESSHDAALAYMQKGGSRIAMFRNVVQRLHDLEIIIQGCFIFGTDQDEKKVFRDTVDFVNELKIDIPRDAHYNPDPNTVHYRRL
jgi:radical SAM superfamily enzyme YgiQ (UPF0313 family)